MSPLFRLFFRAIALSGAFAAAQSSSNCPTSPVTIQSSGDASVFASCTSYTGDIVIPQIAAGDIDMGALKAVSGDLTLNGATNVTSLTAGRLQMVSGSLSISGSVKIALINMPVLTTVGNLVLKDLPELGALNASLTAVNNFDVENTFLPALPPVDSTSVESILVANNIQLNSMSFSVFTVTNDISISANGPNFQVQFPNLLTARNVTFRDCANVAIPSLRNVTGSLGFYESGMSTISAPNLTSTSNSGTLAVNTNPMLTNISFPVLKTVSGGVQIQNNTILKTIEFDDLQTVGGAIDFYGSFDSVTLPGLKDCKGGFNVQSTSTALNCSVFNGEHGSNSVIKGVYQCSGSVTNPGGIGTVGSGSGGKKSAAVGLSSPSSAILLTIAGTLAGLMSVL